MAKQHNPCLDYPLLMIPDRHVSNVCFFVSASDGRCCKMRLPEISREYYCVGCFYGWLLIAHIRFRDLLFLLNPFTGASIDLPIWDVTKSIYRATLSLPSTESNCFVAILSCLSTISFCKLGDQEWTKLDCNLYGPKEALLSKGKLYVLCDQIHLCETDSSTHPKLDIMKLRHHSFSDGMIPACLVESGDEILLVLKGRKGAHYSRELNLPWNRFIVLQLELSTSSWIELGSLRDHILFIGNDCSVSLQAKELGCRGNHIYYAGDHYNNWLVFDMEDGSTTPGPTVCGEFSESL